MLELLSPRVRQTLVVALRLGMRGDAARSAELIDAALSGREQKRRAVIDEVALNMLRAELLYLDGEEEHALEVFRSDIDPVIDALPRQIGLVAADNRNVVEHSLFTPNSGYDFYRLVDQRRLTGIEFWDASAVVHADEAVRVGKHFDALPIYWRELVRTFRSGCWRTRYHASQRMAEECLKLGWPHEAAYHATMAEDRSLAERIGSDVAAHRDVSTVRKTADKLFQCAHLQRHAAVAACVFARIADALPDDQVDHLCEWLIPRITFAPKSWAGIALFTNAWKVVEVMSGRLNSAQADRFLDVAVGHPHWQMKVTQRERMICAANACVSAASKARLETLAEQSLPLAVDSKADVDFVEAINLLCHIAERAGDDVRRSLGAALYPPNTPVSALLVQVAATFDKRSEDRAAVNGWAGKVAEHIRLQVQRLAPHEEPVPVPYAGPTYTRQNETGKLVVQLSAGSLQLAMLSKYGALLDDDARQAVFDAVLTTARDRDNTLGNRASLTMKPRPAAVRP